MSTPSLGGPPPAPVDEQRPDGPQVVAQQVAPVVSGAPVVKQTERPHPLTPFIRGWIVLVAIAVAWLQQLPGGRDGGFGIGSLLTVLPIAAGVVLLAATAGFLSWYFTRFVIDNEEFRLETGAVFKSSKRVPFERLQSVDILQPLAARIFGLAELRIEVGAGDSTIRLRYLSRGKASQLREYLLARAHGRHSRLDDPELALPTGVFTDRGQADRPLVVVSPHRIVLSFLASTEWLATAGSTVVVLVVSSAFDVTAYALPGLIPLVLGAASVVGRRVFAMFNFTLSESPRGLRVTRGLTTLSSQSVPIDRIQGVKTSQPLLWRRFGWYRVDVDIVGYAGATGEDNDSAATSVLLPVATAEEVELAIERVLPGFALDAIELYPSPPRARWVSWFDFWTLRYGWNDRALVTEHGWMTHVRDVLPHAKTQSVRIEQGPLQRRLRLANVHCDTPRGPVKVVAQQLDVVTARELALSQLDRAREARAADRHRQARAAAAPLIEDAAVGGAAALETSAADTGLLAGFGTSRDRLLATRRESEIYALDEARVLRLYRPSHEAPEQTAAQLQALYGGWAGVDVGIEVPVIQERGQRAGQIFTIERRLSGRNFSGWLSEAASDQRRQALLSYLDAVTTLPRLPSPAPGFTRLVGPDALQPHATLAELLTAMLVRPVQRGREDLERDLPDVVGVWNQMHFDLASRTVAPRLVHGDLRPSSAYVSQGPAGPVVTGIDSFSPHTMHADPLIDLVGAVAFLELEAYPEAGADAAWLQDVALQRYGRSAIAGGELPRWIATYRRFYGFYFSDSARTDPRLYAWCLAQLRDATPAPAGPRTVTNSGDD